MLFSMLLLGSDLATAVPDRPELSVHQMHTASQMHVASHCRYCNHLQQFGLHATSRYAASNRTLIDSGKCFPEIKRFQGDPAYFLWFQFQHNAQGSSSCRATVHALAPCSGHSDTTNCALKPGANTYPCQYHTKATKAIRLIRKPNIAGNAVPAALLALTAVPLPAEGPEVAVAAAVPV